MAVFESVSVFWVLHRGKPGVEHILDPLGTKEIKLTQATTACHEAPLIETHHSGPFTEFAFSEGWKRVMNWEMLNRAERNTRMAWNRIVPCPLIYSQLEIQSQSLALKKHPH